MTPPSEKLLTILPSDVGSSISGIKFKVDIPDVEQLLREVTEHVETREKEVRDKEGQWYLLRPDAQEYASQA